MGRVGVKSLIPARSLRGHGKVFREFPRMIEASCTSSAKLRRQRNLVSFFEPVAWLTRRILDAMEHSSLYYAVFCVVGIMVLKEVNSIVTKPYMVCVILLTAWILRRACHAQDEPFHVPQAQAYCNGEWATWDPKITTPPGLYV
jgi:hypothetical protein